MFSADVKQMMTIKERAPECHGFCADLHDPKLHHLEEKQDGVCISLGAEQLNRKEEINAIRFPVIGRPIQSENDKQPPLIKTKLKTVSFQKRIMGEYLSLDKIVEMVPFPQALRIRKRTMMQTGTMSARGTKPLSQIKTLLANLLAHLRVLIILFMVALLRNT